MTDQYIARGFDGRLLGTESALRLLSIEERIEVHDWLRATLERPPLHRDTPAFRGLISVLDALALDILWSTPGRAVSEADDEAEKLGVPIVHPRLLEALGIGGEL